MPENPILGMIGQGHIRSTNPKALKLPGNLQLVLYKACDCHAGIAGTAQVCSFAIQPPTPKPLALGRYIPT